MRIKKPTPSPDFLCGSCHNYVSANLSLAGVLNRNHCPYCLWSRHLDLYTGGDRLSACKGKMHPVGLTLKRTHKKYGLERGELMLVHFCLECRALSINRIAADDDVERLWALYERSWNALDAEIVQAAQRSAIRLLSQTESGLVRAQLFGQAQAVLQPAIRLEGGW